MFLFQLAVLLGAAVTSVSASVASTFTAPAAAPTDTSSFYVGASNGTITNTPTVPGNAFDRFIQIWLENTDYDQAQSNSVFQNLSTQGILLTSYYAVTHPSEPNYIASIGGDFFGLADDDFTRIPNNISTVVDLLDQKSISWSSYQENMPTDGFTGYNFTNSDGYTYYARKHNPCIVYDSVSQNSTRASRIRNFNDFAVDVNNDSLSQWIFVTPNLRDDAHDTTIEYAASWLTYWLVPLLQDPNFNTPRTLIVLTFDENEEYNINNRVFTLLLGGVIPESHRNTTDDTFYTHYSILSTVQNNWNLGNLGRQDTNKTLANVFALVANTTSYPNANVTSSEIPLLNLTGTYSGPLNPDAYAPYLAPVNGTGAGGGPTFFAPNVNTSLNASTAPAPVNLTSGAEAGARGVVGAAAVSVVAGLLLSSL